MSAFKDYEDEYVSLTMAVNTDITAISSSLPSQISNGNAIRSALESGPAKTLSGPQRSEILHRLNDNIRKLKDLIPAMELEVHDVADAQRQAAKQRLKDYGKAVASFEDEGVKLKRLVNNAERAELLGGKVDDTEGGGKARRGIDDDVTRDTKAQLAANTNRMKDQNKTLNEAERLTHEMNETADSTMIELDKQRKTIQHIGDTTRDVDEELNFVQRILKQMHREMIKNKLMLAAIIVVLVILIIGLLYYQFGTSSSDRHENSPPANGGPGPVVPDRIPPPPPDRPTLPPLDPPPAPSDEIGRR